MEGTDPTYCAGALTYVKYTPPHLFFFGIPLWLQTRPISGVLLGMKIMPQKVRLLGCQKCVRHTLFNLPFSDTGNAKNAIQNLSKLCF